MSEIRPYLQSLRKAMEGCDPALVQDALSETEARYRLERERLAWAEPLLSGPEAGRKVMEALGDPGERAQAYRQREQVVAEAMGAPPAAGAAAAAEPVRPWPSFFGVFGDARAYTSVLYFLMALATGIFYFTWAVTGLSLSLGLLILVIGIPVTVFFLGSARALGLGEGRLVEVLLDVRMPRRPPLLPEGKRWLDRLAGLFTDAYTWKCLAYLLIHLPLGIIGFLLVFSGLFLSLTLLGAPLAHWVAHVPILIATETVEVFVPTWALILGPLGGVLGLAGTLHMAMGLGRIQGSLARRMLVNR